MYKVLFLGEHDVRLVRGDVVVDPCYGACIYVETGGKKIIIDPSNRGVGDRVVAGLTALGVRPEAIDHVLNTHFHYDHSFNNYLFPRANIFTIATNWLENRVEATDKLEEVLGLEHIRIMETPGHVADHMSIVLNEGGKNIVFAGDAIDEETLRSGNIPAFFFNKDLYLESAITVLSVADVLVPGHGPIIDKKAIMDLKQFIHQHYNIL